MPPHIGQTLFVELPLSPFLEHGIKDNPQGDASEHSPHWTRASSGSILRLACAKAMHPHRKRHREASPKGF
jgi:hypothetical protein